MSSRIIISRIRGASSSLSSLSGNFSMLMARSPLVSTPPSSQIISLSSYSTVAAESTSPSQPQPSTTPSNPKLTTIVDQIAGLTLLETADLVSMLKTKLNITEIAMPVAAVGAAPAAAGGAAEGKEEAAAKEEDKPAAKTEFKLVLQKFEASAKAKIIREVKNIVPGMNLVEAKKFVESTMPKTIRENVPKEDAEKLKKTLEGLGATISME